MGNTLCNQLSNEDGTGSSPRMYRDLNSIRVAHGSEKKQQQTQQYHVSNQGTIHDAHIPKTNRKPSYITKIKNKSGHLKQHHLSLTSPAPSSSFFSSSNSSFSPGFTTPSKSDQTIDVTGHRWKGQHELASVIHRVESAAPTVPSSPSKEERGSGAIRNSSNTIAFSRSFADSFKCFSKKIHNRDSAATSETPSDNSEGLSIDRMKEQRTISADYQWLEGRRYHDTPGSSYIFPNDIDEVDRLQLQHFILRYAIKVNHKSPLEKSNVQSILDVGCGPGTWTMEMANEYPDATITGIDMSTVFPSTIIPVNCRFIQHNILQPLPFPDNTFDFVYQRLLIGGLTPEEWIRVAKEIERVTKPGGWIEFVEADGYGGNNGPYTTKLWSWLEQALLTLGISSMIARDHGLVSILKQANVVNIHQDELDLPTGVHGGKIGQLLKENEQAVWSAVAPMVIHAVGVDKDDYLEAMRFAETEVEEYKSYHILYIATGQKRNPSSSID